VAVTLRSSIAIAAPRAAVWAALTDTASYPSWNPYYVQVQGTIAPNATLRMQVSMNSSPRRTSASPQVVKLVPERQIVWRNRFLLPGLLTAVHTFLIEDGEDGHVVFRQEESFAGVLLPVSGAAIRQVEAKLDELGNALKARCEADRAEVAAD
jgi:hypothetical protein